MSHKFDKTNFDARTQARKDLEAPYIPPTTVLELRDRVNLIEKVIGVKL